MSTDQRPCSEVLDELERFLDGELAESRLEDIREHLARCYPCADRASFEDQLRALVRENCHESAPPGLEDRIRSRLDEIQGTA